MVDARVEQIPGPLRAPPLVEVACGVMFPEVVGLDPTAVGAYWIERRDDYPERALQPRLPLVAVGGNAPAILGQLRTWLIASSGEFLIQIQPDRFYLNWKRREQRYPSFSDHESRAGLRTLMLREFRRFAAFVLAQLSTELLPQRVEVTKVDFLTRGTCWQNEDDILHLLPFVSGAVDVVGGGEWIPSITLQTQRDGMEVVLRVNRGLADEEGQPPVPVIKVQTTCYAPIAGAGEAAISSALDSANVEVNNVFARLIPRAEMVARFGLMEDQ